MSIPDINDLNELKVFNIKGRLTDFEEIYQGLLADLKLLLIRAVTDSLCEKITLTFEDDILKRMNVYDLETLMFIVKKAGHKVVNKRTNCFLMGKMQLEITFNI